MFQHKCKICRSGKADNIEFCRFYLGWSYIAILESFSDDIDDLSGYNLSTHFNRHTSSETKRFWRETKAGASPEELAELEKNVDEKLTESD
jgi:hypothetical protein